MCGINGIIKHNKVSPETINHSLQKMNQLIFHRGPDDDGSIIDTQNDFALGEAYEVFCIVQG